MVYESDFYTTRRPYRYTPSYSTYTVSKREIPWEKLPCVPRPSLVPDPVTAFGKRKPVQKEKAEKFILNPSERAKIRPTLLTTPPKPYVSARDETRDKVMTSLLRREVAPREVYNRENMDIILPRLHKVAECPNLPYKLKIVSSSDLPPVY